MHKFFGPAAPLLGSPGQLCGHICEMTWVAWLLRLARPCGRPPSGTASGRNRESGPERDGRGNSPETRCEVEKQKNMQSRSGAAVRPAGFSSPRMNGPARSPLGEGKRKTARVLAWWWGLKVLPGDPSAGLIGHPGASLPIRHLFALSPSAKRFVCVAASNPQGRPPSSDKEMEAQKVGYCSEVTQLSQDFLAPPHIPLLPHPVAGESWGPGSRRSSFPPTARSRPQGTWVQAPAGVSENGIKFWVSYILPG